VELFEKKGGTRIFFQKHFEFDTVKRGITLRGGRALLYLLKKRKSNRRAGGGGWLLFFSEAFGAE